MNKQEILNIFEYVSAVDTDCARDLTYSVTLLHTCIEKSLDAVVKQATEASNAHKFNDSIKYNEYCKVLQELEQQIIDCNSAITILKAKKKIPDDAVVNTPVSRPDYTKYAVDNEEVHYLDEDFEHCKVDKFHFENIMYNVTSWKDAWLCLCTILYAKDPEKFMSITESPDFKTQKINVFSYAPVYADSDGRPRNEKLEGTDIYIWTNFRANRITECMRRLLIEFGYDFHDVEIYLRADYKELHNKR